MDSRVKDNSRAHDIAKQVVDNVWLAVAQRVVVLLLLPMLMTAFWTFGRSYIELRDRMATAEGGLAGAHAKASSLELTVSNLRNDLAAQTSHITRLQAQREGDIQIGRRVDELREEMREGNARVNARLDAMMTPPRGGLP